MNALFYVFLGIYREEKDESTQSECYEKCVKKEKPHLFMTYHDSDESDYLKKKLNFDNATVMRPLAQKCLNACKCSND